MAVSKCPKCEKGRFELHATAVGGGRGNVNLIQCASCGTVVGVLEAHSSFVLVEKLTKDVAKLAKDVKRLATSPKSKG